MGRLAEAVNRGSASHPGPKCSITILLAALDKGDAADLLELLAGPTRTTDIHAGLKELGHPASYYMLGLHRRGQCACG